MTNKLTNKLYKGGEITLLESLEKEELINIIQKLEKENKELKEKIYGKKDYLIF